MFPMSLNFLSRNTKMKIHSIIFKFNTAHFSYNYITFTKNQYQLVALILFIC